MQDILMGDIMIQGLYWFTLQNILDNLQIFPSPIQGELFPLFIIYRKHVKNMTYSTENPGIFQGRKGPGAHCVSISTPHTYHSPLLLSPQTSIVQKLYGSQAHPMARVVQGVLTLWDPSIANTRFPSSIEAAAW